MDILQEVLDMLASSGGSATYQALYDALAFEKRQALPPAIKQGRKTGVLRQEVTHVDGVIVHTIYKL